MTPLRFLHISDIHMGCKGPELWPKDLFRRHVEEMVKRLGSPELILITGDIAWSGKREEYAKFDAFLAELKGWLGCDPIVIPVPGNHDLVRPPSYELGKYKILENFGGEDAGLKALQEVLWEKKDTAYFAPLFENYCKWLKESIEREWKKKGVTYRLSHFPGDLSVKVNNALTVVGLNSTWRHFADLDPGKLEIDHRQLAYALNPDGATLTPATPHALLLMHHPPAWFSEFSRGRFKRDIHHPDRFLACLHGHMHEEQTERTAISGGKDRYTIQAPSLFGLERLGTRNESRRFGCTWGTLNDQGDITLWPMRHWRTDGGTDGFIFAPDFVLVGGSMEKGFPLRPATASPAPTPAPVISNIPMEPAYIQWANEQHSHMLLLGMNRGDLRLELEKVFVPLRIARRAASHELEHGKGHRGETYHGLAEEEVALSDIFRVGNQRRVGKWRLVALFGEPGAGKTTALRKLHQECLGSDPWGTALGLPDGTLPVLMRLRRFTAEFLSQPLAAFIERELAVSSGNRFPGLGQQLWDRGRLLLLFDGLDEIADTNLRAQVARKLEDDLKGEKNFCSAISCRYAGYGGPVRLGASALFLDVQPLNQKQVEHFVHLWFQEARLRQGNPIQADRDAKRLLTGLETGDTAVQRIKVLAGNPLLLTLLCLLVLNDGEIPRRRVDFYRECLEVLLRRWRYHEEDAAPPPLDLSNALALLRPIAWQMHQEQRQYDLSELEFIDLAEATLGVEKESKALLEWLHVGCGVLADYAPKLYGFMHLGFQEYLTASHVAMQRDELLNELLSQAGEEWWREVVLLLAGQADRELFNKLCAGLLQDVTKHAELLRQALAEAVEPDLGAFLAYLRDERTDHKVEVLRLLLGRKDAELRKLAAELNQATQPEVVRELAARFLMHDDERDYDLLLVASASETADALSEPLRREGVRLCPHARWRDDITKIKKQTRAAAILVEGNPPPWQEQDVHHGLSILVRNNVRLLPVRLAGCEELPELPKMLRDTTWIDCRQDVNRLVRAAQLDVTNPPVKAVHITSYGHEPVGFITELKTGMVLLPIPGGDFNMGSNDGDNNERPVHRVRLSPYWLGETPITNRQYGVYLNTTRRREPTKWRDNRFADPEQPVVGVNWYEAVKYCQWLSRASAWNFFLPSEAQWEFAARGTDGRNYPWGNEQPTRERACYRSVKPAPVGSFPVGKGPFGHFDLAGNVWEWCQDGWRDHYHGRQDGEVDPVVTEGSSRVWRGGSWVTPSVNLRSAYRNRDHVEVQNDNVGFRVAATPKPR